jgi:anti-repressor protein
MSELIKIENKEINGEKINTANARELHEFLGSKQQFSNWIQKRIKQYDFAQDIDYTAINDLIYSPPRIDYFVSIDMAKELSMAERTAKGKEIRKYFIECEKKLKEITVIEAPTITGMLSDPTALRTALIEYTEKVTELEVKIEEDRPKVELHDALIEGNRTFDFKESAKFISNNIGMKVGQKKLFTLCRKAKIIEKNTNEPYQRHINSGYLVCEPVLIGSGIWRKVHKQPRFTGKGLVWVAPAVQKLMRAVEATA